MWSGCRWGGPKRAGFPTWRVDSLLKRVARSHRVLCNQSIFFAFLRVPNPGLNPHSGGLGMSRPLLIIIACIAAFRFWSLYVAGSNERRLKADGAIEYGQGSTLFLWVATGIVYAGALI